MRPGHRPPHRPLVASLAGLALVAGLACGPAPTPPPRVTPKAEPKAEAPPPTVTPEPPAAEAFKVLTEQFKDCQVLRYQVPGFEELTLDQKKLAYYLYEAALAGRDITWDQKYRHNLLVRRTLEAIWRSYRGDRATPAFLAFQTYTKQVWFSSGIHHHYSGNKLAPEFTAADLAAFVTGSDAALLPLAAGEDPAALAARLTPILFDPAVDGKRTNRADGVDLIATSAVNFYEGVTQPEVEAFYKKKQAAKDPRPPSYGLNSKLVKEKGKLVERTWKVGGMYSPAIEAMAGWLRKAAEVAETPAQKAALDQLVAYYETGDLRTFDAYNIAWVKDTESRLDVVNGFIETYDDPLGYRATFESVVSFKDMIATRRIAALAAEAQWFEDNSPIAADHKKKDVVGITAKVITVIVEGGDAAPTTPIGINLPNADWIRKEHGSKSVNLGNIVAAYDLARARSGLLEEFAATPEEVERARAHGDLAGALHTDLHEVIGHASGQLAPGVGTPKETLKSYASALEEGRADLVALYYLMDPKLVDMGVMPSLDVGRVEYDGYIRSGLLVQLSRIAPGEDLEESHMRNRQMVAAWVFEKGAKDGVIVKETRGGKTYFRIADYERLRGLFGELLAEIQRIKSTGDYEAGRALVETYGVKVDPAIHKEVLDRYQKLGIAPYSGFIQPRLVPVLEGDAIVDVKIEYPDDFAAQMLEYGEKYGLLPVAN